MFGGNREKWGASRIKARHFVRKRLGKSMLSCFLFVCVYNKRTGVGSLEALMFGAIPELAFVSKI